MSEWKPIESAPRGGEVILITDGVLFAAAIPFDYVEPAIIGYDNTCGGKYPNWKDTRRNNPDAGTIRQLWHAIGCSGFSKDADVFDGEYETTSSITPTHWMPLPEPPKGEK